MMDIDITHNEWREENKSQIFRRPTQILTEPKFPGSAPFKSMPGCLALPAYSVMEGKTKSFCWESFYFFLNIFQFLNGWLGLFLFRLKCQISYT